MKLPKKKFPAHTAGIMWENVAQDPRLGNFFPITTLQMDSIRTKLIRGKNMMYIKILSKFQEMLLSG